MNVRQKAKRYKHLYETLSKQPLPVIFKEQHHVDTLRYERAYPNELLCTSPNVTNYIQMEIAQGLTEGLNKYIVYTMNYDPTMDECHVCGEIKVVAI